MDRGDSDDEEEDDGGKHDDDDGYHPRPAGWPCCRVC